MKKYVNSYIEEHGITDARMLTSSSHKDFVEFVENNTDWLPVSAKTSFRIYVIQEDIKEHPCCANKECSNRVSIVVNTDRKSIFDVRVFSTYCSQRCMRSCGNVARKRMETMVSRYGDHNMRTTESKDKFRLSCLEKYGVDNPSKVDVVKNKRKQTNFDRYGAATFLVTPDGETKSKETKLRKYGTTNHMEVPLIKKKCRDGYLQTVKDRYGVDHTTKFNKKFSSIVEDDATFVAFCANYEYAEDIAAALEYHPSRIRARMAECGIAKDTKKSKPESDILSFITEWYDGPVVESDRSVLDGRELDIYIPELSVAIEFNGLYWHSELYKEKKYHQEKSLLCAEKGIQLIHVWEDDWSDESRNLIIKNKIRSICGLAESKIYARKCSVRRISNSVANGFYEKFHIQGKASFGISYGIFFDDGLVGAMSLKELDGGVFDLTRYATSTSIVGGFSKCLKRFKCEFEWAEIFTFACLDYSVGILYRKTGFDFVSITPPNYIYYSNKKNYTLSRYQTMKHKLSVMLESYDSSLSEHKNMLNAGWVRVYDSGSIKFSMSNKKPAQ